MKKTPKVFLIEDSLADQEVFKRAISDKNLSWNLKIFDSASDVLQTLNITNDRSGDNSITDLPELILLDINIPIMNGWQFLKEIRSNSKLKHIPIVILTTSSRETDVLHAYQLGANSYLTKANDESSFIKLVAAIDLFWFKIAKIPTNETNDNEPSAAFKKFHFL